jgi:hypothetical protein
MFPGSFEADKKTARSRNKALAVSSNIRAVRL